MKNYDYYAKRIKKKYHFATMEDSKETLVYDKGVYKSGGEIIIEKECEGIILKCSKHDCIEVLYKIKRLTYVSRNIFDSDPNSINVKNGILDMRTGKISNHSHEKFFRRQIPVIYDPRVGPEKYMKFLMTSLPDVVNRTKAIEAFASLLILDFKLEKMFINEGEGANGKSTYLGSMEIFIGESNVTNISLHELLKDKHLKAELDGKIANIHTDISKKEILELGPVKALISGDSIIAHKKFGQPFKFKNKSRLYYSCNQLPELREDGHAVFRRLYLISWKKVFSNDGPDRINPNLLNEITTESELSGILNLLINVAQRIKKKGHLSYDENTQELRNKWSDISNSIGKFLESHVVKNHETRVTKKEIYDEYCQWCHGKKITPQSNRVFNEKLSEHFQIEPSNIRIGHTIKKVWKGIEIIPNVTVVAA